MNKHFRRDMMKKIIGVLLVILMIVGLTSCKNEVSQKNVFIEKVKILETNEFKLNTLEISYDEFKENIRGIFPEKFEKYYLEEKENTLIFKWDNKEVYIKDLEGISDEELAQYRKMSHEKAIEYGFEKSEERFEISDENYEGTFDGEKRVYSRKTHTIYFAEAEPLEKLLFTLYDFKKVDDEWKISNRKSSFVRKNMKIYDKGLEKMREATPEEFQDILASIAFTPENNDAIKYVESFNLVVEYH